jgi:hypothetical protein
LPLAWAGMPKTSFRKNSGALDSMDAKRNRLDDYIVTIQELELVTGKTIPVDEYLKFEKPEYS